MTNVLPYVMALSALVIMMKVANVPEQKFRVNVAITTLGMLYSVYAIYASGKDAVLGGMLVTALSLVAWGFLAPRFALPVASEPAKAPPSADPVSGRA